MFYASHRYTDNTTKSALFLILFSVGFFIGSVLAQPAEQKLITSLIEPNDRFGTSVAISELYSGNNYLAIGAPGDEFDQGSVYIYEYTSSWAALEQIVFPNDGYFYQQFGTSLAIDSLVLLVGSPHDNDNGISSGSVYIYTNNFGWTQQAKLLASDGSDDDEFGADVSFSGNFAIIGAPKPINLEAGAAYVFEHDGAGNWTEIAILSASNAEIDDRFGSSVDIVGDLAIVGAPGATAATIDNAGLAYVFQRDSVTGVWVEVAILDASDPCLSCEFGIDVAISDDLQAIIGKKFDNLIDYRGAAYVFGDGSGSWTEQQKLLPAVFYPEDGFGVSVAISDSLASIGAWQSEESGTFTAGATYIFQKDSSGVLWTEHSVLTASDFGAEHFYGIDVDIAGEIVVVGAPGDAEEGASAGSAYFVSDVLSEVEPPAKSLTIELDVNPANLIVPAEGDTFDLKFVVTNHTDQFETTDVWINMFLPGGGVRTVMPPRTPTVDPFQTAIRSRSLSIVSNGPAGDYLVIGYLGTFPTDTTCADTLIINKRALGMAATPVPNASLTVPSVLSLSQNYPNPFNPATRIEFGLPADGEVKLTVYNVQGQRVANLLQGALQAGWHSVEFDGAALPSGQYIYQVQFGGKSETGRMMLVK